MLVGEDAFRNILELADGTLISPATAADLLDQAVIETMLFEGPSRVLDLGQQRNFVGAARRAVEIVHRTCTGQGCHIGADRCEIDHILPWTWDGPTHPDNGRPRCPAHHRQLTRRMGHPAPPPRHPTRPNTTAASPAPPTSSSPAPASATASSTTPPGAHSPPHPTTPDVRGSAHPVQRGAHVEQPPRRT